MGAKISGLHFPEVYRMDEWMELLKHFKNLFLLDC